MTAILVLNWNGRDDTRACLRSIEAVRDEWSSCAVVDNASSDGSPEIIRSEFPWARLIESPSNLGYAGGNNLGIQALLDDGASEVLVLNNDTTLEPGTVAALRDAVRSEPSTGLAGAAIYSAGERREFWYAGGEITWQPFGCRELRDPALADAPSPTPVDYVPGCALMGRSEVFGRIGLFEERYFLCWEDADLSVRVSRAGLRNVVVPRTCVRHHGSRAFDGNFSPLYTYHFFRSMLLFASLHFPPRERGRAYRDTVRLARRVFQRRRRHDAARGLLPALALAFVHFAAGRYGAAPRLLVPAQRPPIAGASP